MLLSTKINFLCSLLTAVVGIEVEDQSSLSQFPSVAPKLASKQGQLLRQTALSKSMSGVNAPSSTEIRIKVVFYGESKCPFCRKFVTDAWPKVWQDVEGLRRYLDYDFIPWGNSYFATQKCNISSNATYNVRERECWYEKCWRNNTKSFTSDLKHYHDDDCFSGEPIYQHGEMEGILDVYETCIKVEYTLEDAVAFTYCAEGNILDNENLSAEQIMRICSMSLPSSKVDSNIVQNCYLENGREIEISNAKMTPAHPGVPYVLVDGISLDNPMDIQRAICKRLQEKGLDELPDSCLNMRGQMGLDAGIVYRK